MSSSTVILTTRSSLNGTALFRDQSLHLGWADEGEWVFLQQCLTDITTDLQGIRFPETAFGSIGDALCVLTEEQFLWFLPHAISKMASIGDDGFGRAVADRILALKEPSNWQDIRSSLSTRVLLALRKAAKLACELGWEDNRGERRYEQCLAVLVPG